MLYNYKYKMNEKFHIKIERKREMNSVSKGGVSAEKINESYGISQKIVSYQ